jgi:hypothetical protein
MVCSRAADVATAILAKGAGWAQFICAVVVLTVTENLFRIDR